MAWDINRVVLVGRLSNEVELRYTPNGAAVARFGIAVGGRPNNGQDTVSFFTVVVWNKAAETANQYLKKGSKIAVDGRLEQRSWTAQDGARRSVVEIIADRLEFLSTNPQGTQGSSNSNYSQQNTPKVTTPAENAPKRDDDYYDNTDFNDAVLDDYQPFDEDVPF
ncbi:MAG: single-stranded DNA-binding protein [Brevinema sp.]